MWRDGICTDHDESNGKVTTFDSIQMLLSAISSFHISGDQSSERKKKTGVGWWFEQQPVFYISKMILEYDTQKRYRGKLSFSMVGLFMCAYTGFVLLKLLIGVCNLRPSYGGGYRGIEQGPHKFMSTKVNDKSSYHQLFS